MHIKVNQISKKEHQTSHLLEYRKINTKIEMAQNGNQIQTLSNGEYAQVNSNSPPERFDYLKFGKLEYG